MKLTFYSLNGVRIFLGLFLVLQFDGCIPSYKLTFSYNEQSGKVIAIESDIANFIIEGKYSPSGKGSSNVDVTIELGINNIRSNVYELDTSQIIISSEWANNFSEKRIYSNNGNTVSSKIALKKGEDTELTICFLSNFNISKLKEAIDRPIFITFKLPGIKDLIIAELDRNDIKGITGANYKITDDKKYEN
ncbi:MAG: hypothetical protein HZB59_00405 [Ignavibacteriales bacterium]|nr:hypothetical protein [Ignavibacteriales bacterium]